jgi:sporadic carbohydrate cluster 2OG-Fe(II) oxygenase/sporadic carbohydrate cluster protein (TIGR04323 family)
MFCHDFSIPKVAYNKYLSDITLNLLRGILMDPNALDPRWDNQTLVYNLEKHNWPAYWLGVAQELFPQITELETVHKILTPQQISELGRYCQAACDRAEFQERVDAYFGEYVPDLLDGEEWMLQRFFTIRIVIPNQEKAGRLLAFHQGIWVGNGLGLRTIWTPFTKCYETNSMWITDWDKSDELTTKAYAEKWDYDHIQEECGKHSWPVTLEPGQAHLFQQHHIHGNFNNDTDITRWSMDGRVLPKGGHYHRKLPGGYFRFIGERDDPRGVDNTKNWISYANWNTDWSEALPLPMQRAIIEQYCKKYDIRINDYQFENEYLDWLPGLEKFISLPEVDCIVLTSIYNLPDDPFRRLKLLNQAVAAGKELHFANELCSVRDQEDIKHIQNIFEFVNENTHPNVTLGLV